MSKRLRFLPVLAVAAFLAGCEGPCNKIDLIGGPLLTSGSADFTTVAAVGTGLSAGFQSGGLVNRHQVRAFPALFAAHVGGTVLADGTGGFTFPAINGNGIDTLLRLVSLSPLVISKSGRTGDPATFTNVGQAADYHNLAVPGQLAADVVDSTLYAFVPNPVRQSAVFFDGIYRHRGLGLQQLVRRAPTFVTFELGLSEVLGAVTTGSEGVFPSASFDLALRNAVNGLHAALPNTKAAILNVPDVTALPFCTTFLPATLSTVTGTPVALIGHAGPLSPTDLVLLTAKDSLVVGTGFPVGGYNYLNPAAPGNGRPLLDAQVLDDAEQALVDLAVFNMNATIDSLVANRPWAAKVDVNALMAGIAANGFRIGSTEYTTEFVTGGLVSLDGVMPGDLLQAILCNALIDAVNDRFGATVPRLILSNYTTPSSSRLRPASGDGARPVLSGGPGVAPGTPAAASR